MSTQTESSRATRPSLLARLKDWSQQTAWREFDHDYAPLLRNVARKAGLTDAEADEVAQETLIAVAKKIGEFKHAGNCGSFRAWLYQQARWRIADQFRLRKRAACHDETSLGAPASLPAGDSPAEMPALPGNDPAGDGSIPISTTARVPAPEVDPAFEHLWAGEWEQHIRQCALARIKRRVSARQFQLFDLHVLQGLSVRAAARAAGTTMAAVYMAKSRVARLVCREVKRLKAAPC
ncbi:MAG: sigma-70 family RNA polymerase sigma factor [Chloroflexi bacterium]|nr:sigma-70 family RNA polymerase sigma factor [Chloroflexota bacterium]